MTMIFFLVNNSINSTPIVNGPVYQKENLEEIGIILVQGALIEPEQYVALLKKIQETSKEYKTWGCISDTTFDLPLSYLGKWAIENCFAELIKKGMNQKSKIFLMGHSLGGEAALSYYMANPTSDKLNIQGLIMVGSIPERTNREQTRDLNILIIGGELDGLSRLTRTTEEFYHRNMDKNGDNIYYKNSLNSLKFLGDKSAENKMTSNVIVIAIEGLNHMSYCSGAPSTFVAWRDLKAEVTKDAGFTVVSKHIHDFIKGDETSLNLKIEETKSFMKPLIDAFEYEGSIHFNRPDQSTCVRGGCGAGSKFTIDAQKNHFHRKRFISEIKYY